MVDGLSFSVSEAHWLEIFEKTGRRERRVYSYKSFIDMWGRRPLTWIDLMIK